MSQQNNPNNAPVAAQFHEARAQEFIIRRLISEINTALPVKVVAVHSSSEFAGTVDVTPLLASVNTDSKVIPPSTIYNAPYFRLQGGASAIILDPQPGDIGFVVCSQADASNVIATRDVGPPNTARRFSLGDSFYFGGFLGATPTQFIRFDPAGAGIDIVSPGELTLNAIGNVTIDAALLVINAPVQFNNTVTGTPTTAGAVTFGAPVTAPDFIAPNAKLNTHQHNVSGSSTVGNPHN